MKVYLYIRKYFRHSKHKYRSPISVQWEGKDHRTNVDELDAELDTYLAQIAKGE